MSRDMTLFQDDFGEAFLLTASEKNQIMQLSELSGEHLSASGYWKRIFIGENLEAPNILRHDGECYFIGSHCTGWCQIPHMQPLPTRSRVLGSCWATLGGVECNLRRRPTWGDASDIRFDGDSSPGQTSIIQRIRQQPSIRTPVPQSSIGRNPLSVQQIWENSLHIWRNIESGCLNCLRGSSLSPRKSARHNRYPERRVQQNLNHAVMAADKAR
jgi:hypothetical protein